MDKAVVLGFVRHALTFAGGAGLFGLAQNEWETAVSAAITLAGIVWSVWDKRGK